MLHSLHLLCAAGPQELRCDERDVLGDVFQRLTAAERPVVLKALEALQSCFGESADGAPCCAPTRPGKGTQS